MSSSSSSPLGGGGPLAQDDGTGALMVVNFDHHEIHDGCSFTVSDTVPCNSATVKWQIRTPDSLVYTHLLFEANATGEATFLVTEGSDRTDGTALTEVNRRRVGTPAAAGTIVTRTPTAGSTDGAVTLLNVRNGATGQGSKTISPGATRGTNEWILKPDTKYVVSVTTYASVYVSMLIDWYEHTDLA